jgi:hypothetical protein
MGNKVVLMKMKIIHDEDPSIHDMVPLLPFCIAMHGWYGHELICMDDCWR